jgi:hypothetical protein
MAIRKNLKKEFVTSEDPGSPRLAWIGTLLLTHLNSPFVFSFGFLLTAIEQFDRL